jgi:hypothetical protein
VASGAAQMMVIQLAPAPKACCAESFTGVGDFPVGDDDLLRTLGAQGCNGVKPFGQTEDGPRLHDINVIL